MLFTWIVRIALLAGGLALHWAIGTFLIVSLYFHMKNKAHLYDQRYNLGGNINGPDGRPILAPWYIF